MKENNTPTLEYKAAKTVAKYIQDRSFLSLIMGPIGSGKSVGSFMKMVMLASEQKPDRDGIRRTRFAVIRNTIRQLEDTTMVTGKDWFKDGLAGTWKDTAKNFYLGMDRQGNINLMPYIDPKTGRPDGTFIYSEWWFRALDRPDQLRNLLSAEYTGAFVNEYREVIWEVLRDMTGRVGRYPSEKAHGVRASWKGIIGDSNPPPVKSPIYNLFEDNESEELVDLSEDMADGEYTQVLFKQPSGLGPDAENLEWLPDGRGYYNRLVAINKKQGQGWIDTHVHGKYGMYHSGKSVFGEHWDATKHKSSQILYPDTGSVLGIGVDFGARFTAFVIGQLWPNNKWLIYRELVCEDMGLKRSLKALSRILNLEFPEFDVRMYIDPAGRQRGAASLERPIDVLRAEGFKYDFGPEHLDIRLESVREALVNGMMVAPKCTHIIAGFDGGYHWRRMQKSGEFYSEMTPEKTIESHPHDALQYLVGYFEAPALSGRKRRVMAHNQSRRRKHKDSGTMAVKRPRMNVYGK